MEIWKSIPEYEGYYEVSNFGRVRSIDRSLKKDGRKIKGVILKLKKDRDGYLEVGLSKNGNKKSFRVHRLVCMAFLGNDNKNTLVNHKNGVRDDNRIENLEWCNNSFNQWHRCYVNNNPPDNEYKKKRVEAVMPNRFSYIFNSVTECARFFHVSRTAIERKLKGKSSNPSYDKRRQCIPMYGVEFKYVV